MFGLTVWQEVSLGLMVVGFLCFAASLFRRIIGLPIEPAPLYLVGTVFMILGSIFWRNFCRI